MNTYTFSHCLDTVDLVIKFIETLSSHWYAKWADQVILVKMLLSLEPQGKILIIILHTYILTSRKNASSKNKREYLLD